MPFWVLKIKVRDKIVADGIEADERAAFCDGLGRLRARVVFEVRQMADTQVVGVDASTPKYAAGDGVVLTYSATPVPGAPADAHRKARHLLKAYRLCVRTNGERHDRIATWSDDATAMRSLRRARSAARAGCRLAWL